MTKDIDRLLDTATPLEEALRIFAHLRSTADERRALDFLMAREQTAPLPEPLLVAAAGALIDRGETTSAARLLQRAESTPGLMLRAELLEKSGDAAAAVALIERVMLRDIDWPGARERHLRWRRALGLGLAGPRADPSAATIVTSDPAAPFRLLREAGRGGAGCVYEAEDHALGRRVALKVYHRPDRDRSQLLHEARVAVALRGNGVVRVFDVDPGPGWLAMEWVGLGALKTWLRDENRAALDPIERWAVPLAHALARVHAAGWVHHDVKPANILMRSLAAPLLTDFGTARRVGEPSPPGSLGYVSPERIAGRTSDPRDDVYGFGRVIEDALDVVMDPSAARWRSIATSCTGPDGGRPADGGGVMSLVG